MIFWNASAPGPSLRTVDLICYHGTPLCQIYVIFQNTCIIQVCSRICNWLSLRCLVPWVKHLPLVCKSTLCEYRFKRQFACEFDMEIVFVAILNFVFIYLHIPRYLLIYEYIISYLCYFTSRIVFVFIKHHYTSFLLRHSLTLSIWCRLIYRHYFIGNDTIAPVPLKHDWQICTYKSADN